ncbi:hypothetical protein CISIN_1g033248mg [Citrus sinensis]|uniref:Uncharacterized protein n=1 Tax=Citrus sinensis TaxID=2711 RepID=A0A067G522_CITSI|nr:hypothetical protein CISIN_1g033248mg [Citrus sinensis]
MASVSMAMPLSSATQNRLIQPSSESFLKPLPVRPSKAARFLGKPKSRARLQVQASLKEKVAEAAGSGLSPSLKNFLLSIVAGGVVLAAIVGAVIGVANFDPVKRT